MQPYQNFQPQMAMPFQYPPYGQPQMAPTPYMDRMSQLQAMQQSMQPVQQLSGLNGRIVDNLDSIVASDVPMDGSFAVFPKRDLSEIYIRHWTGEGKIATISFKPILDTQSSILPMDDTSLRFDELNDALGGLYDKVDNLSNRIDEVLKSKVSQRSKERSES